MAFKDACTEVTMVGEEKVTVPAGSFTAKHYHSDKYESRHVGRRQGPVLHAQVGGKSHEIVLAATGEGAKSAITENQGDAWAGPTK